MLLLLVFYVLKLWSREASTLIQRNKSPAVEVPAYECQGILPFVFCMCMGLLPSRMSVHRVCSGAKARRRLWAPWKEAQHCAHS